ncbi:hypothetical protein BGZ47_010834 [Haplosporangium gracile]|nr:hypothetical protein BGZ47_010834 [Haplosporangium gracile]
MHLQTITVAPLLALFSFTASTASAAAPRPISLAVKDDCDRCIDNSMIKLEPACAKLSYIGHIDDFADSKLTLQHRKCFCAIPPNSDWYQNCYISETCGTEKMDLVAYMVSIWTTETVCPAPGSAEANATTNAPNSAVSGKRITSAATVGVAGAAAVFSALL